MRIAGEQLAAVAAPYLATLSSPDAGQAGQVEAMIRLSETMRGAPREQLRGLPGQGETEQSRELDRQLVLRALRAAGPSGRTSDGMRAWGFIPLGLELDQEQRALLDASARGLLR